MRVLCLGMQRSGSTLQELIAKDVLGDEKATHKDHAVTDEYIKEIAGGAKVLYIWRDLRDVTVSRKKMARPYPWKDTIREAVRTWFDVQKLAAQYPDQVLIQRYETSMENFQQFVREIADFLGKEVDAEALEKKWSLKSIRKADPDITPEEVLEKFGPKASHINSNMGQSVWREELSKEDLGYLVAEYEDWFEASGCQIDETQRSA